MTVLSIVALFVCAWSFVAANHRSPFRERLIAYRPSQRAVRLAMLSLVPIFALELVKLVAQVRIENGPPYDAWMQTLPIPVYNDRTEDAHMHGLLSAIGLCAGIAATAALGTLYAAMRAESAAIPVRSLGIVAAVLALASIVAPAMSTTDPYEYVATGLLGIASYAPPHGALATTMYAPYANHVPLVGVIYGPLWVLVDCAQTYFGTSVLAKILLLRISNALLVGLLYVLLGRAGVSRAARTLFIANPAIWWYDVVNPHADIQGLVAIAAAWLAARRSNAPLASALLAAAGLIKLPFVVIGAAALVPLRSLRARVCALGAAGVVVAAGTWLVTHAAFSHDFSQYVAVDVAHQHAKSRDGWLLVGPIVVAFTALLIVRRTTVFGSAWLFNQIAPLAAAWYVLWGIPLAAVTGSLDIFLVAMPLATALIDSTNGVLVAGAAIATALFVVLAVDVRAMLRAAPSNATA